MITHATGQVSVYRAEVDHNGATAVTVSYTLPVRARIDRIVGEVVTAITGATVMAMSAGSYAASTNLTLAGGRTEAGYTAANLTAMEDVAEGTVITVTFTPTGTATAGRMAAALWYTPIIA